MRHRLNRTLFSIAGALLLTVAAFAQSVRWDPPGGQLGFNQVSQISLVFEGCEPEEGAKLPQVEGLSFGRPAAATSSSFQVGFGGAGSSSSKTYTLTFPVRPEKRATLTIPTFNIQTDKGSLKVPPARFTVGDAPVGLLWGDARPANMVVDDRFDVVGLLDWELAGCGAGEFDVAWFMEMNRMRSLGMGIEPLPGFLDDAATWHYWSVAIGREPTNVDWHHRFAAYRVAVLVFLFVRAAIRHGRLPSDHRLLRDNLGTRRLAELFPEAIRS